MHSELLPLRYDALGMVHFFLIIFFLTDAAIFAYFDCYSQI